MASLWLQTFAYSGWFRFLVFSLNIQDSTAKWTCVCVSSGSSHQYPVSSVLSSWGFFQKWLSSIFWGVCSTWLICGYLFRLGTYQMDRVNLTKYMFFQGKFNQLIFSFVFMNLRVYGQTSNSWSASLIGRTCIKLQSCFHTCFF